MPIRLRWAYSGLFILACIVGAFWRAELAHAQDELTIVQGRSETYRSRVPIANTTNSNPRVVEAAVDRRTNEIVFFGRRRGTATYTIADRRNPSIRVEVLIRVIGSDMDEIRRNLIKAIGDIEGVVIRFAGENILLEGEVSLDSEIRRIDSIATRYPQVINNVTLSPLTLRIFARTIEKDIGLPDVQARPLKDSILLEGVVYSEEQKVKAETIAKARFPRIVNTLEVRELERPPGRAKTIVLNVHFLELSKQTFDKWGIEWTPLAISGNGISGFFQQDFVNGEFVGDFRGQFTATISAFIPKLERAKASGYVRVLENPILSVKEGSTASMNAGAEIPFVVGFDAEGRPIIDFKDIGVTVGVTPYAQGDSVDMQISVEVKELGDASLGGVAANDAGQSGGADVSTAILKTSFTTAQFARAGESIVIGGMFRISDSVVYNRPVQRSPDAVIQLLRTREYEKRKSQFVVFVTPQIHTDSTTANRELKELFNLSTVSQ